MTSQTMYLPQSEVVRILKNSLLFTSPDLARPVLTCVMFQKESAESPLKLVSTDSYGLLVQEVQHIEADALDTMPPMLFEADDLERVIGMLKHTKNQADWPATITFDGESQMAVTAPNNARMITLKTYPGEFPPYKRLWRNGPVVPDTDYGFNLAGWQLARIAKLAPKDGMPMRRDGGGPTVQFQTTGDGQLQPVLFDAGPGLAGLCMPVRQR